MVEGVVMNDQNNQTILCKLLGTVYPAFVWPIFTRAEVGFFFFLSPASSFFSSCCSWSSAWSGVAGWVGVGCAVHQTAIATSATHSSHVPANASCRALLRARVAGTPRTCAASMRRRRTHKDPDFLVRKVTFPFSTSSGFFVLSSVLNSARRC